MTRNRLFTTLVVVGFGASLALAGCSDDEEASTTTAASETTVAGATPEEFCAIGDGLSPTLTSFVSITDPAALATAVTEAQGFLDEYEAAASAAPDEVEAGALALVASGRGLFELLGDDPSTATTEQIATFRTTLLTLSSSRAVVEAGSVVTPYCDDLQSGATTTVADSE